MCAVIGFYPSADADATETRLAFAALVRESVIRGMHSYGLAWQMRHAIQYTKTHSLDELLASLDTTVPCIFHARYSTSGDWQNHTNNQPIVVTDHPGADMAIALNGVVDMGTKEEIERRWEVSLESENDAEIVLRRMQRGQNREQRLDILDTFVRNLTGSFAAVLLVNDRMYAIRNARRPLWRARWKRAHWFASTRDIFVRAGFPESEAQEVTPGGVYCV